jgi:hypothetical protein
MSVARKIANSLLDGSEDLKGFLSRQRRTGGVVGGIGNQLLSLGFKSADSTGDYYKKEFKPADQKDFDTFVVRVGKMYYRHVSGTLTFEGVGVSIFAIKDGRTVKDDWCSIAFNRVSPLGSVDFLHRARISPKKFWIIFREFLAEIEAGQSVKEWFKAWSRFFRKTMVLTESAEGLKGFLGRHRIKKTTPHIRLKRMGFRELNDPGLFQKKIIAANGERLWVYLFPEPVDWNVTPIKITIDISMYGEALSPSTFRHLDEVTVDDLLDMRTFFDELESFIDFCTRVAKQATLPGPGLTVAVKKAYMRMLDKVYDIRIRAAYDQA